MPIGEEEQVRQSRSRSSSDPRFQTRVDIPIWVVVIAGLIAIQGIVILLEGLAVGAHGIRLFGLPVVFLGLGLIGVAMGLVLLRDWALFGGLFLLGITAVLGGYLALTTGERAVSAVFSAVLFYFLLRSEHHFQ